MTKQRTPGKDHLLRNGNWSASFSQKMLDYLYETQLVWDETLGNYIRPEGHKKAGTIVGHRSKSTRYWHIPFYFEGKSRTALRHQLRHYDKAAYIPWRVDHIDLNRENDSLDNLRDQAVDLDLNKFMSPSSLNNLNSENTVPDYPKGMVLWTNNKGYTYWRVSRSDLTLGVRLIKPKGKPEAYIANMAVKLFKEDQFEEALAYHLNDRCSNQPRECWPPSLCRSYDDGHRGPYAFYFYGGTVWTEEEKAA